MPVNADLPATPLVVGLAAAGVETFAQVFLGDYADPFCPSRSMSATGSLRPAALISNRTDRSARDAGSEPAVVLRLLAGAGVAGCGPAGGRTAVEEVPGESKSGPLSHPPRRPVSWYHLQSGNPVA